VEKTSRKISIYLSLVRCYISPNRFVTKEKGDPKMQNLRNLRKENKITQAKMAEDLGVSIRTITKWEKEDYNYPSINILTQIANYFHVSPQTLMGSDEETRPIIIKAKGHINKKRTVDAVTYQLHLQAAKDKSFNQQLSEIGHIRKERLIALSVDVVDCAYRLAQQIIDNNWEDIITMSQVYKCDNELAMQWLSLDLFHPYSGFLRSEELTGYVNEIVEIIDNPMCFFIVDRAIGPLLITVINYKIFHGMRLTTWRAMLFAEMLARRLFSYKVMQKNSE